MILVVDGSYLAHRSFDAPYKLVTSTGLDSTMIHTFIRSLNALRKKFNPNKIIIAWDVPTNNWRTDLYPSYKSNRTHNTSYIIQLHDLQILLYLLKVKQFYAPQNEGDDVIATLVKQYSNNKIIIFSTDKDLMQLVNDSVLVYDGKTLYDSLTVKKKFFVEPYQIPDLLAICGDKSDNIKGIKGYGYKKASKLLKQYKTVESIPNNVLPQTTLFRNKQLTKLNSNCNLKLLTFNTNETIESILDKYELKKVKEKLDEYKLLGDRNATT